MLLLKVADKRNELRLHRNAVGGYLLDPYFHGGLPLVSLVLISVENCTLTSKDGFPKNCYRSLKITPQNTYMAEPFIYMRNIAINLFLGKRKTYYIRGFS